MRRAGVSVLPMKNSEISRSNPTTLAMLRMMNVLFTVGKICLLPSNILFLLRARILLNTYFLTPFEPQVALETWTAESEKERER